MSSGATCARWIHVLVVSTGVGALENLDFRKPETIVDRRVDLCKQRDAVLKDNLKMENALRGVHITAVTTNTRDPWFEEKADGMQTGFHYELMREVALSAGFSFTIVAHPKSSFRPGLSYDEYLNLSTAKFDINLNWYCLAHMPPK